MLKDILYHCVSDIEQGMGHLRKAIMCRCGTDIVQAANSERRGPDNAGFSIVEVMIGIAVFSVGVLAILSMQISGVKGNSIARHYTEASTIGVDKIEALMALPYTHADLQDIRSDGVAGLFNATGGSADHSENDPSGQYTIFWNVADEDIIEHSKTVSVIVVWTGNGMKRSVSMQRIIPEII